MKEKIMETPGSPEQSAIEFDSDIWSLTSYTTDERREIVRAYRGLLKAIRVETSKDDLVEIRQAFVKAVISHAPQRRKSGEPYIFHPIAVARICAEEIGLGGTSIIAALLHDVVEDTPVTLQELELEFGSRVTKIVDGLTKLDHSYSSESPQAENLKKVLATLAEDVRVVLIKMADRLHNMRTLDSMPPHKQLKIAAETDYIYAPLAHRLGLYNIKTEFQDLCLKISDRETFSQIAKKLAENKRERSAYINEFIRPLTDALNETGYSYRIFGRPKSIYSIWNKIKNKNVAFEDIYDLFAIRIVMDVPQSKERQACWSAYATVTEVYKNVPERLKDWVSMPKSNGYESLHTTVIGPKGRFVEVQIRSARMDDIAERGFAAHWKYKGIKNGNNMFDGWLTRVREMLDNMDSSDAVEFLADFKESSLFAEEIFVYTPKGELRILHKGATALDFAFEIHSDVGAHCMHIKVNRNIVQFGHKLKTGDQVEVETQRDRKPTEDWLRMVTSSKARSKIRQCLRDDLRKQAEFGREILQRKMHHHKVDFDEASETLRHYLRYPTHNEFFNAIQLQIVDPVALLKKFKVERGKLVLIQEEQPISPRSNEPYTPKSTLDEANDLRTQLYIANQNAAQYHYQMSTCCNPVMGDDVFAYVNGSQNTVKIHRTNCKNATHLMANYGYRIMEAAWRKQIGTNFIAGLRLKGVDTGKGVIHRMSKILYDDLNLNIRSFNIFSEEEMFICEISLFVNNREQLENTMEELKKLPDVREVNRISIDETD
ncbi:MAG: hypothetical protein RL757_1615 [Bacteroidota bacterium]|jgi:GTP pyrophosphokinase